MEHIYHYTNLETLKLILQNRTFRLSSLNRMDDLEEGETGDFQKLGKHIYVSSWTKNHEDSLLLWTLYSRTDDGVRLRMKTDIFKTEKIDKHVMMHGVYAHVTETFNPGILERMLTKNVSFVPPRAVLQEITYTNDENLIRPTVHTEHPNGFQVATGQLGIFKRYEWRDQQEVRHVLRSLPVNVKEMAFQDQPNGLEILLEKIRTREDFGFIDLSLRDDAFDDLEILCGPKMSGESKEELNEVLAQYGLHATVRDSKLKIRS